jgi:hypothetical protein
VKSSWLASVVAVVAFAVNVGLSTDGIGWLRFRDGKMLRAFVNGCPAPGNPAARSPSTRTTKVVRNF